MAPLFTRGTFFVIAGPCVLEDHELNLRVAEGVARIRGIVPGAVVFKSSFDKANRANEGAHRGPGLDKGLSALASVRDATGLSIITDVHLPEQCAATASVVDALQIPAFLCRQTDLLHAAGATGKPVNVKKGQWMSPEAMSGAIDKVRSAGSSKSANDFHAVTERGSFFGYGDLVVDMRSIPRLSTACNAPVIFDATHSLQRPGSGPGGSSGGAREFISSLACAAVAAGADGIFLETHPDPDRAPSDGQNMLPLAELEPLITRLVRVFEATRK